MSEAPNILRQANALKESVLDKGKTLSDCQVSRQKLEEKYENILLLDLEYGLDQKVEQDLWNNCFKHQITTLQSQAKDRKNVRRTEAQATLSMFLERSSGFYFQMLEAICDIFKLDLPFRRKSALYGVIHEESLCEEDVKIPKKTSCLYICQYCLVHLGDIARYRQQTQHAESFYRHAAQLIPVNGHPYNQLAILKAARGDKLSTVFYYIRSLALRCPFSLAATNLEQFYVKISKDKHVYKDKLSFTDYINAFLQFNALIHLSSDFCKCQDLSDLLISSLPTLITSAFTTLVLLQFISVSFYTLSHIYSHSKTTLTLGDLSSDEKQNYDLVFKFIGAVLETLLAYTPKTELKAKDFYCLPTIKIILEWLKLDSRNFEKDSITNSTTWPHLAKLLNCLQTSVRTDDGLKDDKPDQLIALPEDIYLRGFSPLENVQSQYTFTRSLVDLLDEQQIVKQRSRQLVNFGVFLSQNHPNLLCIKEERHGRHVFASPIPLVTFSSDSPSPEKRGRQNIAMQAIMQGQQTRDSTSSTSDTSLLESDGISADKFEPKYLLGTPVNEFDSRKSPNTRPTPSLYNAKATTKPTPDVNANIALKKSKNLDDQPIQTSSQNPGLIQIGMKDIQNIEKASHTANKTSNVVKHYRTIAPRHRNKVPESLQQKELVKHMEEKPFFANKESWPALGELKKNPTVSNDKLNFVGFHSEPQQTLQAMNQSGGFPVNVTMPARVPGPGMNLVRYPAQNEMKDVHSSGEIGSHRYSRMNRSDLHNPQESHSEEFNAPMQMVHPLQDVNNSNNLLQQAAFHLPIHLQNQSNINHQPPLLHQNPMAPSFSLQHAVQFPQQPRPFPDLRPQLVPAPFPQPFSIPSANLHPGTTDADQHFQQTEYSHQNKQMAFIDSQRQSVFPTMGFMINNPPPIVAQSNQGGVRMYGMDGSTHLQNGEHGHPNIPNANANQTEAEKTGTYSLFSGGPWSMHISSAGESNNQSTSLFMSNITSLGSSRVTDSTNAASTKPVTYAASEWGQANNSTLMAGAQTTMQSLWNNSGPSPLQRLLEQQRQQRQTDPR